ncbi:LLM class flavin-dependent oxidoreductase [Mucilaginibacter endophyticus]|uniref:LLM class flavin-dependent oxidoreductase n=1 Tax=Mucilaginibacter endophyticus TaxID=2675003 RepID=UPI000E0D0FBE|nr:LLM class flavin-dependent oxidoreductase [Mucilaginibacter endophyticus]
MEIGIDSFAAVASYQSSPAKVLSELLERMVLADQADLAVFGIGEHHRKEYLDSANTLILAAAAAKTKNIRLMSAVTVLSAADPVRVFQAFSTLDLLSDGRAEIVAGRGSSVEAFPLFGYRLEDYDALFAEKLDLLLQIIRYEKVTWSGKFRAALENQSVYPRPLQDKLPVWLGVGGTPGSFIRAGQLGLPLMVSIIGGDTKRFRPLIDLYKMAGEQAGYKPEHLKVALHSLGYVSKTSQEATDDYFPGYAKVFTALGKERGWAPITRASFNSVAGPEGAIIVGNPEQTAEKILRHSEALGGLSRVTFQMDNAELTHKQLMKSIELIGEKVIPLVNNSF